MKIFSTITFLAITSLAHAQESNSQSSALERYLTQGGPLTIAIVLIGLSSLILVAIFCFFNLTKSKFTPKELEQELTTLMAECRVRSTIEVASAHPSTLGRMIAYSYPNIDANDIDTLNREEVETAEADFIMEENRKHMFVINILSLISQLAPMLGLFGTVFGMIGAFAKLASKGSTDQLSSDIAIALLTTMWGLIVAMLAVIAYFYFKSRYQNLISTTTKASENLINASLSTIHGESRVKRIPEGISS